ncbi:hypothetical protein [Schnuerera sp.]|nr:hypothetical protein [Schnuerera sp.]HSH35033.1 hypothetical protein [Schnuerera sp.]
MDKEEKELDRFVQKFEEIEIKEIPKGNKERAKAILDEWKREQREREQ